MVKSVPVMQETWVQSLGCEDLLEKEMATHSSILAWKIPWTEEPGGLYSPWGHRESDMTERLNNNSLINLIGNKSFFKSLSSQIIITINKTKLTYHANSIQKKAKR